MNFPPPAMPTAIETGSWTPPGSGPRARRRPRAPFRAARLALILALLTLAGPALPGRLEAQIMVEVVNYSGAQAYICFSYHDLVSNSRITRGWWPIAPNTTVDIRVNSDRPELSWYAYNSKGRSWGGREGAADSERRHVVLENFLAKEGWKPRGKQHRMVEMKKERARNGRLRLTLTQR